MRFAAHVKVIACDGVFILGNTENGCILAIDEFDAGAMSLCAVIGPISSDSRLCLTRRG